MIATRLKLWFGRQQSKSLCFLVRYLEVFGFLCFCFISSFVCRSLLSVFLSYETLPFVSCYVVSLWYVSRHMCLVFYYLLTHIICLIPWHETNTKCWKKNRREIKLWQMWVRIMHVDFQQLVCALTTAILIGHYVKVVLHSPLAQNIRLIKEFL